MIRSVFAPLLLGALLGGCATSAPPIASERVRQPVAIDGDHADWGRSLRPVTGQEGILFGVRHTADRLFLVVVATGEEAARRVAFGGLTVWFNAGGGQEQVYGLRYPVGLGRARGDRQGARGQGRAGAPADRPGGDPAVREARLQASFGRVAVLREGGREATEYALGEVPRLDAAAVYTETGFVAELELPLGDGAFDLSVAPGGSFGMGLELPPARRLRPGTAPGMGAGPGFPGAGDGPGRRGGAGGGPERTGEGSGPVTTWFSVHLGD